MPDKPQTNADRAAAENQPRNTHNHAPARRAQEHLHHSHGKRKAELDKHVPLKGE